MGRLVAVDIDGVLANLEPWNTYRIPEAVESMFGERKRNMSRFHWQKQYGMDSKDWSELWESVATEFYTKIDAHTYAQQAMWTLKRSGYEIVILTNRNPDYILKNGVSVGAATTNWLEEHGIIYDRIIYTCNKAVTCLEQGIHIAIEDDPANVKLYLDAGISCITVDNIESAKLQSAVHIRNIRYAPLFVMILDELQNDEIESVSEV